MVEEVKQVENMELGQRVLSKKEIENQELEAAGWGGKQKKKGKQQKVKQQKEAINHTIDILNLFNQLELKAPIFQSEVSQQMQQLKEKKTYFEQNPDKFISQQNKQTEVQIKEVEEKQETQAIDPNDFPTL